MASGFNHVGRDVTAKERFSKLVNDRGFISTRISEYAHWTLPYLHPVTNRGQEVRSEELAQAAGSIGARCVNHLANRIAVSLFQPYRPFFKLTVTEAGYSTAEAEGMTKADVDSAMAMIEQQCAQLVDAAQHRSQAVLALKHLIVTGNALVRYEEGKTQVYNFHDYVLKRDMAGEVYEILTNEKANTASLPVNVNIALEAQGKKPQGKDCDVDVFTWIRKKFRGSQDDYVWSIQQEVEDIPVDIDNGLPAQYAPGDLPWIPLSWSLVRGEDYGRGLVEDYAYSFHAHKVLSAAQMQLFAVMSDIKFFIEPSVLPTPAQLDDIVSSPPGSWFELPKDSVWTIQTYSQDAAVIDSKIQSIERELAQAFLLNSAAVRDAERVTAEEIRMQVQELETSYGGVYSKLASEWQSPLAVLLLKLTRADALLNIPGVKLDIVTGIESMSRMGELDNIRTLLSDMAGIGAMPPTMLERLKQSDLWTLMSALRGIDSTKFVYSEEEFAAIVEQQQQAEMQRQEQLAGTQATANAMASMAQQL